jgi:3-deoxy-7-phosphoheptulonate synthase
MSTTDQLIPISPSERVSTSPGLSDEVGSSFEVAGRHFGGKSFCLIAGPCTVESREQTLSIAKTVNAAGVSVLRGGAFKPRRSPYTFRGLGKEALEILAEAREITGLPIVTELLDTKFADVIAEYADIIQVGSRNMDNYILLEVAGQLGKPVLLKRGLGATLEEFLMAADYILKDGNERVILCERGIRTFETATRFTLDISAVPWLKQHSGLPVIVDPSHASGDRKLVTPLARAAVAAGADGLLVEVHDKPEEALCDGNQALYSSEFAEFVQGINALTDLEGRTISR